MSCSYVAIVLIETHEIIRRPGKKNESIQFRQFQNFLEELENAGKETGKSVVVKDG